MPPEALALDTPPQRLAAPAGPTLLTLLSRLESIPSMPEMYAEVVKELESEEPSIQKVGQIIARDVGMSASAPSKPRPALFTRP